MAAPTAPGRIDRAAAGLRRLVAAAPGARLPGERDLAERLHVPRPRLRRLLAELEHEGLVVRRHGSGTYAVGGGAGAAAAALRQVTLLLDADFKLGRDPFCATVIEHVEAACAGAGARLALARTDGGARPGALGDGAIALGAAGGRLAAMWRDGDAPLVALFSDATASRRASVAQIDDAAAGAEAARALVERGCATLLFVGRRDLPGVRARLAGAQAHARASGVALAQRDCPLTHAGGLAAAATAAIDARTGVIAANDWLAVGLRAGLAARGGAAARAPIVAFDGLAIAADPALAIASLQPPYAAIAADALAELARLRVAPGRALRYACAWRS